MSTNSTACPHCGAPLKPGYPKKHGWGENSVWTCGREVDDGPGRECPNKPKADGFELLLNASTEPVDKMISVSAVVDVLEPSGSVTRQPAAVVPNELAEIEKIKDGINRFMGADIEREAKELLASTDGITVAGHTDGPKAGREAVHSAYMRLMKFRTQMIESGHELYKKPINALGKLLDGRKSDLLRMTADREASLKADRDAFDAAEKARKEAAERAAKAEKERLAAEAAAEAKRVLQERIQRLVDLGATPNVIELAGATDEQFEAMVAEAATVHAERLARQEADRVERERLAELQRARTVLIEGRTGEALRAGVAAFWKTLDELADMDADTFHGQLAEAIEAKALADQEKEAARAEQEAMAAENARLRREAAERDKADRIAREAAAKAEREAREAEAAAARAAEEAARIERERPDREKALKWLDAIDHDLVIMVPVFSEQAVTDIVSAGLTDILGALHELQRNLGKA